MVGISMNGARSVAANVVGSAILFVSSIGLSGCIGNCNNVPGVPLDQLDMSASTPGEIALAGPDNVILTVGDRLDITVEGGTGTQDLRFDLSDDKLRIGREGDWLSGSTPATIRVTMPAPREVSLAGSGTIAAATLANEAEVDIAGSGSVNVATIASERLEVSMAGSGDMKAAGTVQRLEVSKTGSGDIDLAALTADTVEISIAGSGDIALASDGEVTASIAGSGDIEVIGNAKCTLKSVGSGTLDCKPGSPTAGPTPPTRAVDDEAVAN